MIQKFKLEHLRNPEHLQFAADSHKLFVKHGSGTATMLPLYDNMGRCVGQEESALAREKRNKKIAEKNHADIYRDKLHGKFFNHLKSILCDEEDPKFNAAQRVMAVVKEVGNPTRLAENAESAMLTTLGNKLKPYRADLEAIGAQEHVDKLLKVNNNFIELEAECRRSASEKMLSEEPSAAVARKTTDAVYRHIISVINAFADAGNDRELYKNLVAEMNILVAKYDGLIAQRKGRKSDNDDDK
jgi:hypothetical protein